MWYIDMVAEFILKYNDGREAMRFAFHPRSFFRWLATPGQEIICEDGYKINEISTMCHTPLQSSLITEYIPEDPEDDWRDY